MVELDFSLILMGKCMKQILVYSWAFLSTCLGRRCLCDVHLQRGRCSLILIKIFFSLASYICNSQIGHYSLVPPLCLSERCSYIFFRGRYHYHQSLPILRFFFLVEVTVLCLLTLIRLLPLCLFYGLQTVRIILHFQHLPVPSPLPFFSDLIAEPRPFTEPCLSLERCIHCSTQDTGYQSGFLFLCLQKIQLSPRKQGQWSLVLTASQPELAHGMSCRADKIHPLHSTTTQQCTSQGYQHFHLIALCALCHK